MEKKILWIISFALIFILWVKVGPFKSDLNDTQDELSETNSLQEESGEATADEKATLNRTRFKRAVLTLRQ